MQNVPAQRPAWLRADFAVDLLMTALVVSVTVVSGPKNRLLKEPLCFKSAKAA
jgi:hypothetical protein